MFMVPNAITLKAKLAQNMNFTNEGLQCHLIEGVVIYDIINSALGLVRETDGLVHWRRVKITQVALFIKEIGDGSNFSV